jgi:hypothetical protein
MMTFHSLMTIPSDLYSNINLILYRYLIVFVGCPKDFMMWFPLISVYDVELEDDGFLASCFCFKEIFLHIHIWSLFIG